MIACALSPHLLNIGISRVESWFPAVFNLPGIIHSEIDTSYQQRNLIH